MPAGSAEPVIALNRIFDFFSYNLEYLFNEFIGPLFGVICSGDVILLLLAITFICLFLLLRHLGD